jgi:Ca2+-binding EF-hand superfamily protein
MEILDADQNGTIEKHEFINWVEKGLLLSTEQRQKFRSGSTMRLRLDCFLTAVEKALSQQPAEILRHRMHKLFDHFDQDKSGTIDTVELHDMIQELSLMMPHTELPTTDDDLKEILKALAHNDDGIINEIELINWLYNGVATTPESKKAFSRQSAFNRRLVNLLEALIAWLQAPEEFTDRLMPAPGTRPKRRDRLTMQSNFKCNSSIKNGGKNMTVEEMRALREQEELSEFERLRLKAKEKQRAKLTSIRQAVKHNYVLKWGRFYNAFTTKTHSPAV